MSTKDLVHISLFTSIICALAVVPPIMLPLSPVPITMQSLGVLLCGGILGAQKGGGAAALFILMIVLGIPVLVNGASGIGVLLGPSGGFLLGFPVSAYVIGLLFERNWNKLNYIRATVYLTLGAALILLCGVLWLSFVSGIKFNDALYSVVIFIPGDIFKIVLASSISITIKRYYPLIQSNK